MAAPSDHSLPRATMQHLKSQLKYNLQSFSSTKSWKSKNRKWLFLRSTHQTGVHILAKYQIQVKFSFQSQAHVEFSRKCPLVRGFKLKIDSRATFDLTNSLAGRFEKVKKIKIDKISSYFFFNVIFFLVLTGRIGHSRGSHVWDPWFK